MDSHDRKNLFVKLQRMSYQVPVSRINATMLKQDNTQPTDNDGTTLPAWVTYRRGMREEEGEGVKEGGGGEGARPSVLRPEGPHSHRWHYPALSLATAEAHDRLRAGDTYRRVMKRMHMVDTRFMREDTFANLIIRVAQDEAAMVYLKKLQSFGDPHLLITPDVIRSATSEKINGGLLPCEDIVSIVSPSRARLAARDALASDLPCRGAGDALAPRVSTSVVEDTIRIGGGAGGTVEDALYLAGAALAPSAVLLCEVLNDKEAEPPILIEVNDDDDDDDDMSDVDKALREGLPIKTEEEEDDGSAKFDAMVKIVRNVVYASPAQVEGIPDPAYGSQHAVSGLCAMYQILSGGETAAVVSLFRDEISSLSEIHTSGMAMVKELVLKKLRDEWPAEAAADLVRGAVNSTMPDQRFTGHFGPAAYMFNALKSVVVSPFNKRFIAAHWESPHLASAGSLLRAAIRAAVHRATVGAALMVGGATMWRQAGLGENLGEKEKDDVSFEAHRWGARAVMDQVASMGNQALKGAALKASLCLYRYVYGVHGGTYGDAVKQNLARVVLELFATPDMILLLVAAGVHRDVTNCRLEWSDLCQAVGYDIQTQTVGVAGGEANGGNALESVVTLLYNSCTKAVCQSIVADEWNAASVVPTHACPGLPLTADVNAVYVAQAVFIFDALYLSSRAAYIPPEQTMPHFTTAALGDTLHAVREHTVERTTRLPLWLTKEVYDLSVLTQKAAMLGLLTGSAGECFRQEQLFSAADMDALHSSAESVLSANLLNKPTDASHVSAWSWPNTSYEGKDLVNVVSESTLAMASMRAPALYTKKTSNDQRTSTTNAMLGTMPDLVVEVSPAMLRRAEASARGEPMSPTTIAVPDDAATYARIREGRFGDQLPANHTTRGHARMALRARIAAAARKQLQRHGDDHLFAARPTLSRSTAINLAQPANVVKRADWHALTHLHFAMKHLATTARSPEQATTVLIHLLGEEDGKRAAAHHFDVTAERTEEYLADVWQQMVAELSGPAFATVVLGEPSDDGTLCHVMPLADRLFRVCAADATDLTTGVTARPVWTLPVEFAAARLLYRMALLERVTSRTSALVVYKERLFKSPTVAAPALWSLATTSFAWKSEVAHQREGRTIVDPPTVNNNNSSSTSALRAFPICQSETFNTRIYYGNGPRTGKPVKVALVHNQQVDPYAPLRTGELPPFDGVSRVDVTMFMIRPDASLIPSMSTEAGQVVTKAMQRQERQREGSTDQDKMAPWLQVGQVPFNASNRSDGSLTDTHVAITHRSEAFTIVDAYHAKEAHFYDRCKHALARPWSASRPDGTEQVVDGLPFGVMLQGSHRPLVTVATVIHLASPSDIYPVKLPGKEEFSWMHAFIGPRSAEKHIAETIAMSAFTAEGVVFQEYSPRDLHEVSIDGKAFLMSQPFIIVGTK